MPLINGSESLVSRTALAELLVADGAVPFKAPTPTVETKFRVLLTSSDDDELALNVLMPPVGPIGNGHCEASALSTSDTPQWAFTELPIPKFTLVEDAASLSVNAIPFPLQTIAATNIEMQVSNRAPFALPNQYQTTAEPMR